MLGLTTHQNCLKHPMYCHTHPLYYPIRWAYTPNSSLEQKNTDSSNHNWSQGRLSPISTSAYE